MVGMATVIGTPIGILAGTYLAEYGGRTWVAGSIRFINDILLSAPSIIIGLFVESFVFRNIELRPVGRWGMQR